MPALPLLLITTFAASASEPDEVEEILVEEVVVDDTPDTDLACETHTHRAEMVSFPASSPEELLRAMPGLHTAAFGSRGHAYQYILRGFDSQHGRDLAVTVEGVPWNEPSNIRSHGYLDLFAVPMALVDGIDLYKGAERADVGNFGTAGSAHLRLGADHPGWMFRLGGGSDGSGTIQIVWRPQGWDRGTFVLGELDGGEGIGQSHGWRHVRLASGIEDSFGPVHLSAMLLAYDGRFSVPGLLREDDLEDGVVRFYDAYRGSGDGGSRRLLLTARMTRPWRNGSLDLIGWLGGRGLSLWSNASGYYDDASIGDGTRDRQATFRAGMRGSFRRVAPAWGDWTTLEAGFDLTGDFLRQHRDDVDRDGEAWRATWDAGVQQTGIALWAKGRVGLGGLGHLSPGLRVERTDLRVRDHLPTIDDPFAEAVLYRAGVWAVAPKVAVALEPLDELRWFASYGRGFRSPEAQRLVASGVAVSTRADTAETGFDVHPIERLDLTTTGFFSWSPYDVLSDVVTREDVISGPTWRYGVETAVTVRPIDTLRAQVEFTWTEARDVATRAPLPFVPRWLVSGGLYVDRARIGKVHLTAGIRWWQVGRRPLPGGYVSASAFATDLTARIEYNQWFFDARVDSLVPVSDRTVERVQPSWFDTGTTRSELPEVHFLAGEPTSISLAFGGRF